MCVKCEWQKMPELALSLENIDSYFTQSEVFFFLKTKRRRNECNSIIDSIVFILLLLVFLGVVSFVWLTLNSLSMAPAA